MKTDRELLELAAKAVGLHAKWPLPDFGIQWNGDGLWCSGMGEGQLWNPLADDGDALRLAVKLQLSIICDNHGKKLKVFSGIAPNWSEASRISDAAAATRRAIVLCAAEIGKAMP